MKYLLCAIRDATITAVYPTEGLKGPEKIEVTNTLKAGSQREVFSVSEIMVGGDLKPFRLPALKIADERTIEGLFTIRRIK
jgi:hypothetical protein